MDGAGQQSASAALTDGRSRVSHSLLSATKLSQDATRKRLGKRPAAWVRQRGDQNCTNRLAAQACRLLQNRGSNVARDPSVSAKSARSTRCLCARGKPVQKLQKRRQKEGEAVVYSKFGERQVNPASVGQERWHAVSVVGASEACPSAVQLRACRFLPQDAPRLPSSSLRMNVDASSARIVTATTRVTSKGDAMERRDIVRIDTPNRPSYFGSLPLFCCCRPPS